MRKLTEVRQATELMNEAISWSVFKWMFEKPRVRETADIANDALDRQERTVKAQWPDSLKAAYAELTAKSGKSTRRNQKDRKTAPVIDARTRQLVEKIMETDDDARRARIDAEATFDEAERVLSISLAQKGCRKAITAWEMHEKAIRKAENVIVTAKSEA
jgi:hypothetical protein